MDEVNIHISQEIKPNLSELNEIKNGLESINNNDSDDSFSCSTDDSSSNCSSSSKVNKKYIIIDKNNNSEKLESIIHYMKLDMVNKDIEIEDNKIKLMTLSKYELLFKNIEFLFERLNYASTTLKERINSIPDKDFYKHIMLLENSHSHCLKIKDKYNQYLNTEIIPHCSSQQNYLKHAISVSFAIKDKEFTDLTAVIGKQIINTKYKQFFNHFLLIFGFIVILFAIILNFYRFW